MNFVWSDLDQRVWQMDKDGTDWKRIIKETGYTVQRILLTLKRGKELGNEGRGKNNRK